MTISRTCFSFAVLTLACLSFPCAFASHSQPVSLLLLLVKVKEAIQMLNKLVPCSTRDEDKAADTDCFASWA